MTDDPRKPPPEDHGKEPWYEAEDIGCGCQDDDPPVDSEWEWRAEEGCYVCSGCGQEQ